MNVYINSNAIADCDLPEVRTSNEYIDWKWVTINQIKELEVSIWFKKLLSEKKPNI